MKPVELLYLVVGLGILIRGTIDHGLTPTELGAAAFILGLIPVTRADNVDQENGHHRRGPKKALRKWLDD